jgi:hypothetical protein
VLVVLEARAVANAAAEIFDYRAAEGVGLPAARGQFGFEHNCFAGGDVVLLEVVEYLVFDIACNVFVGGDADLKCAGCRVVTEGGFD